MSNCVTCGKEIQDYLNYCSWGCIKNHVDSVPPNNDVESEAEDTEKTFCTECQCSHRGVHDGPHMITKSVRDVLNDAEEIAQENLRMSCFEAWYRLETNTIPEEFDGWAVWVELSCLRHLLGNLGDFKKEEH